MTWYKDRDFTEVKASNADIIAVIENPKQLQRVIDEYNKLEDMWLESRSALSACMADRHRIQEEFNRLKDATERVRLQKHGITQL